MKPTRNNLGQPIGGPLPGWSPPPTPLREPMQGRYCWLEPLDLERHAEALFEADAADAEVAHVFEMLRPALRRAGRPRARLSSPTTRPQRPERSDDDRT